MSNEVARVLRAAADLIEPEGRWTTGVFARDGNGMPVRATAPEAVCWCAEGAVACTGEGTSLRWDALAALDRHIWESAGSWHPGIGPWNDRQRSVRPIVAALRAAADEAERSDA